MNMMPQVTGHYTVFAHDADIGIRGEGETEAEAFAAAARALTAVVTVPESVAWRVPIPVHCDAPDRLTLFVDWINALIFEMSTRKMLFSRFDVSITDGVLSAIVWGEPIDRGRHEPAAEPKGATYTAASVVCNASGWRAQCIVDV
jgi:tRNA nucleotidyltransferase (CCA-adding enzyme)